MTSEELRAFLNERPDSELHAAVEIAQTILRARRRARPDPEILNLIELGRVRHRLGRLRDVSIVRVCPAWEDDTSEAPRDT